MQLRNRRKNERAENAVATDTQVHSDTTCTWEVCNPGSFASVRVDLPVKGARLHCESDAVVTMSEGVDVRGELGSGGVMGGLARSFLTQESFFTTTIESVTSGKQNVLLAAQCPGDVVLHCLGEDLYLTSGAYLAADSTVTVSSELQVPITSLTICCQRQHQQHHQQQPERRPTRTRRRKRKRKTVIKHK